MAYQTYLESIAQIRQIFGDVHTETAMTTSNVGGALIVMKRYEEAERYLLESHELLAGIQDSDHEHMAEARQRLASLYLAWDRPTDAAIYQ